MRPTAEPYKDPLIDEIRHRRADLYKSLGGHLRSLFEPIQRLRREHPEKVRRPGKAAIADTGTMR